MILRVHNNKLIEHAISSTIFINVLTAHDRQHETYVHLFNCYGVVLYYYPFVVLFDFEMIPFFESTSHPLG